MICEECFTSSLEAFKPGTCYLEPEASSGQFLSLLLIPDVSSFQVSLARVEDVRVSLEALPLGQPATPSTNLYAYGIPL